MSVKMLFAIIALIVIALIFGWPLLVAWVWGWVVPDLFSGAVQQGLLPASMTYGEAFKLMILFSVLGLTASAGASIKR